MATFIPFSTYPETKSDKNIFENLPGGKDCFNFSAFSLSKITRVYKYREHLTLNFVLVGFFFILTAEERKMNFLQNIKENFFNFILCKRN